MSWESSSPHQPRAATIQSRLEQHSARIKDQREHLSASQHNQVFDEPLDEGMSLREIQDLMESSFTPQINTPANLAPRESNVEDLLLQTGQKYQERREQRRLDSKAQERKGQSGTPTITGMARGLERPMKVEERLSQLANQKREQKKAAKAQLEQEELEGVTFKPQVTRAARDIDRGGIDVFESQIRWAEQTKQGIEALRKAEQDEVAASCSFTPNITERSAALEREARPIEDRLYSVQADTLQKRYSRWEQQMAEECPGVPEITEHAAQLHREGNATDRLYQDAEARAKRRDELQRQAEEEEMRALLAMNQHTSAPTPGSLFRRQAVEDSLLERGTESQRRHDSLVRSIQDRDSLRHTPHINERSQALANRKREKEGRRSDLYGLTPKQERQTTDEMVAAQSPFKPQINKRSRDICNVSDTVGVPRHMLLHRIHEKRLRGREERAKQAEERALDGHTFSPTLVTKVDHAQSESIYKRTSQWRDSKIKKQQDLAAIEASHELDGCTFTPVINKAPPVRVEPLPDVAELVAALQEEDNEEAMAEISRLGSGSTTEHAANLVESVSSFVARLERGRQQKADADAVVTDKGKGWTPKCTTPKAFRLGHSRKPDASAPKSTVSSLQAPVAHISLRDLEEGAARRSVSPSPVHVSVADLMSSTSVPMGVVERALTDIHTTFGQGRFDSAVGLGQRGAVPLSDEYAKRGVECKALMEAVESSKHSWRDAPPVYPPSDRRGAAEDEHVKRLNRGK
ncbi:hypothetical protein KIPB_008281, partial [Kipferlia bialata]|eukprot:g8281.t1